MPNLRRNTNRYKIELTTELLEDFAALGYPALFDVRFEPYEVNPDTFQRRYLVKCPSIPLEFPEYSNVAFNVVRWIEAGLLTITWRLVE